MDNHCGSVADESHLQFPFKKYQIDERGAEKPQGERHLEFITGRSLQQILTRYKHIGNKWYEDAGPTIKSQQTTQCCFLEVPRFVNSSHFCPTLYCARTKGNPPEYIWPNPISLSSFLSFPLFIFLSLMLNIETCRDSHTDWKIDFPNHSLLCSPAASSQ